MLFTFARSETFKTVLLKLQSSVVWRRVNWYRVINISWRLIPPYSEQSKMLWATMKGQAESSSSRVGYLFTSLHAVMSQKNAMWLHAQYQKNNTGVSNFDFYWTKKYNTTNYDLQVTEKAFHHVPLISNGISFAHQNQPLVQLFPRPLQLIAIVFCRRNTPRVKYWVNSKGTIRCTSVRECLPQYKATPERYKEL